MEKSSHTSIIGITTYGRDQSGNFYLPGDYVDAVREVGGVPILLTPGESKIEQISKLVNGIIFAGGGDIDPAIFGGLPHPAISRVDSERDAFELQLAKHILNEGTPILGICRGIQILNIATGGDLIVHIPDEIEASVLHIIDEGVETEHSVLIEPDSQLAKIIGKSKISVMSKHHQGVGNISKEWDIVAKAADGVIEALEHKTHPWMVAVQWHPELSLNEPDHQKIFQALIKAASGDND